MNKFVNYLNSLNNASGDNENAIAENQYKDEDQFFKKVFVRRKITETMVERIKGDTPIIYFLTGHAGDGKTSILLQAIDQLLDNNGLFELEKYSVINIKNGKRLHYVKDISELPKDEQIQRFECAINIAREENTSSIVISNTGQLLNLFIEKGYSEHDFLGIIDSDKGEEVIIDGICVRVINIALCDNTDFIRKFISNIICDELWSACQECACNEKCPTFLNAKLVKKYESQVTTFIENFYRWNSENNNRATIRQMVSHISYAITGNVNCRGIHKHSVLQLKDFHNNFANLFFGYKYSKKGLVLDSKAKNIAGIRELHKYRLDSKKLSVEYDIFIKENFNGFGEELKPYVQYLWREYRLLENKSDYKAINAINAIKRVYMLFNNIPSDQFESLYKELYSEVFPYYVKLKNNQRDNQQYKKIQKLVFNALFKLFTGFPAHESEKLYLTLKQNGEKIQNVQVVQGYIYKDDVVVQELIRNNIATGEEYKEVVLSFGAREPLPLSYKMLEFLYEINNGIVQTQIDPMLSQGIDNIKVAFKKVMKKSSKGELVLLVYTGERLKTKKLHIEDGYIEVSN